MNYRIITIPESVTSRVRADGRDPVYNHPAHSEIATGYGPCRQCLGFFEVGVDRRILFTHDTFLGVDSLRQPGPVFIHQESCLQYDGSRGFPPHLSEHALTLEAYGKGKQLRASRSLTAGQVETAEGGIKELLGLSGVDYIIVRDTSAGCFDCAIVRDSDEEYL
ncbi:MAG: DUF1203 domain-containing protein [Gemmatimonadaceae bacterium]|nr:DUF1203 domain-containing protein [Gemmatimonadaceae bacterium]